MIKYRWNCEETTSTKTFCFLLAGAYKYMLTVSQCYFSCFLSLFLVHFIVIVLLILFFVLFCFLFCWRFLCFFCTKWWSHSKDAIMQSWCNSRHSSVSDSLQWTVTNQNSSLSLPITLTSLCMCTPCGADTKMEIHFEPPFDKRFVNLCVFTIKWVKPLIKACILTHSLIVRTCMEWKKLWN